MGRYNRAWNREQLPHGEALRRAVSVWHATGHGRIPDYLIRDVVRERQEIPSFEDASRDFLEAYFGPTLARAVRRRVATTQPERRWNQAVSRAERFSQYRDQAYAVLGKLGGAYDPRGPLAFSTALHLELEKLRGIDNTLSLVATANDNLSRTVRRVQNDDEVAFEELTHIMRPVLDGWAHRRQRTTQESVHDMLPALAMTGLWRAARAAQYTRGFAAYVRRHCEGELLTFMRGERALPGFSLNAPGSRGSLDEIFGDERAARSFSIAPELTSVTIEANARNGFVFADCVQYDWRRSNCKRTPLEREIEKRLLTISRAAFPKLGLTEAQKVSDVFWQFVGWPSADFGSDPDSIEASAWGSWELRARRVFDGFAALPAEQAMVFFRYAWGGTASRGSWQFLQDIAAKLDIAPPDRRQSRTRQRQDLHERIETALSNMLPYAQNLDEGVGAAFSTMEKLQQGLASALQTEGFTFRGRHHAFSSTEAALLLAERGAASSQIMLIPDRDHAATFREVLALSAAQPALQEVLGLVRHGEAAGLPYAVVQGPERPIALAYALRDRAWYRKPMKEFIEALHAAGLHPDLSLGILVDRRKKWAPIVMPFTHMRTSERGEHEQCVDLDQLLATQSWHRLREQRRVTCDSEGDDWDLAENYLGDS